MVEKQNYYSQIQIVCVMFRTSTLDEMQCLFKMLPTYIQ